MKVEREDNKHKKVSENNRLWENLDFRFDPDSVAALPVILVLTRTKERPLVIDGDFP